MSKPVASSGAPGQIPDRQQAALGRVGTVCEEIVPGVFYRSVAVFDADGGFLDWYRTTPIP